jgi:hypothetical protein
MDLVGWLVGWLLRLERCGLNSSDSGQRPLVGSCEHGNEPLVSIKGGEFLD